MVKPKLRGVSHEIAAYFALITGAVLTIQAWNLPAPNFTAALVYSPCVVVLFAISAIYHRPHWKPAERQFFRKLDHCAIYIQITGTMAPLAILGLKGSVLVQALWTLGAMAAFGILKSLIWTKAPKAVSATFYVGLSFAFTPFFPALTESIGPAPMFWLYVGAAIYILGAVTYVLKKPNPVPEIFGYHEVFHLLVILAAALHYWIVAKAILGH